MDAAQYTWIQYQLQTAQVCNQFTITSANDAPERDPQNITLQVSNDGTNYTNISTYNNQDFTARFQKKSFTFSNTTAYKYYRFQMKNHTGTLFQIAEIEILTGSGGGGQPTGGCMAIGANLSNDAQWSGNSTIGSKVFKSNINWASNTNPYTADVWQPEFINDIKGTKYTMIRFMDWGNTNFSTLTNWTDRTKPTDNNYQGCSTCPNKKGIAYEFMVKLCNESNKHMWINVPHLATDDYVRQLATLIKNNLNSGLKVYLEYSNETWNYTFSNSNGTGQLNYVQNRANALGLPGINNDYKGQSFYVYRSLQVFKIFNDVFGTASGRIRKVLAYSGNEDVALRSLDIIDNSSYNPNGIKPDMFAIAPYIGDNASINTGNASSIFRQKVDASVGSGGYVTKFKATLDNYNNRHTSNKMIFTVYEGGQHFTMGGGNQKAFTDNPNCQSDYTYMLDKFKPYFNTFMQFTHVAKCDVNDCWGTKTYYGESDASAPKYRALRDFMNANNCGTYREEGAEEDQVTNASSVIIAPNPASHMVKVLSSDTGVIAILNLNGVVLDSKVSDGTAVEFDLTGYTSGIYLVKTGSKISKLVVE